MELSGPGVQYIADNQLVRRMSVTTYTDYFLYIISASKLGKGESPELNIASLQAPLNENRLPKGSLRSTVVMLQKLQSISISINIYCKKFINITSNFIFIFNLCAGDRKIFTIGDNKCQEFCDQDSVFRGIKGDTRVNLDILKYLRAALSKVKATLPEVYLIGAHIIGLSLAKDWTKKFYFNPDFFGGFARCSCIVYFKEKSLNWVSVYQTNIFAKFGWDSKNSMKMA